MARLHSSISRRAMLFSGAAALTSAGAFGQAALSGSENASALASMNIFDPPLGQSPEVLARNETYWEAVRSTFPLDPKFTWLANGPGGNAPQMVLNQMRALVEITASNVAYALPSFHDVKESGSSAALRATMAEAFGCEMDEIALQRNTMEGMATCIYGISLKAGDEVVSSVLDYDSCLALLKQREEREGIRLRLVKVSTPASAEAIVSAFAAAITPRTRMMMVCHMTTNNGQIFPVRELSKLARQHDIFFLVDGAHGPGQLAVDLHALGCDAYAASLHKWMNGPRAAGFLYVRRERIAQIAALYPDRSAPQTTSEKYEFCGTVQYAAPTVLPLVFEIYRRMGIQNREARLRYLREYWMGTLRGNDRIRFLTDPAAHLSCAIVGFRVHGTEPTKLKSLLRERYRLRIKSTVEAEVPGLSLNNIAASFTNSPAELDRLIEAVQAVLRIT